MPSGSSIFHSQRYLCLGRGHLQEETETWDKGGTQESMGVTLAVTHYIGDMEPEEATFCIQTGALTEQ